MTHHEAITILLDTLSKTAAERPSPELRRSAEQHAADCSACWETVRVLYDIGAGSDPPESERMRDLYGCEAVQDDLHRLTDLSLAEMRATDPTAVRHLSWCHACRELFVELVHVERSAARGELGERSPAQWTLVPTAVGRTLHELVGRIVVEVRDGVLTVVGVPKGFALAPGGPAIAWRGAGEASAESGTGRLHFDLAGTGAAELALEPQEGARVEIALRVVGAGDGPFGFALRAVGDDRLALLAVETVHGDEAARIRDVPPGKYLLELEQKADKQRFRMALTIATANAG